MVAHPFVRSNALFVPIFLWYNEVILSTGGVFLTTLYVTDLDGTLLNVQGRVSSSTAALLRPLVDRGLALTIATARTLPGTAPLLVVPVGIGVPFIAVHRQRQGTAPGGLVGTILICVVCLVAVVLGLWLGVPALIANVTTPL